MLPMCIQIQGLASVSLNDQVRLQAVDWTQTRQFQETFDPIAAAARGPPLLQRQSRVWFGNSVCLDSWQKAVGPEQIAQLSCHAGRSVCTREFLDSLLEALEARLRLLVRRR